MYGVATVLPALTQIGVPHSQQQMQLIMKARLSSVRSLLVLDAPPLIVSPEIGNATGERAPIPRCIELMYLTPQRREAHCSLDTCIADRPSLDQKIEWIVVNWLTK